MSEQPEFPQGDLTREVIGAFFDVYNYFRPGFLEAVYAGGLAIELRERGITFRREARLDVRYKGRIAGVYRADFLVEERLVLELKACVAVGEFDRRQLLNYLRITGVPLGLLLHFGPEPQVMRVVNSFRGWVAAPSNSAPPEAFRQGDETAAQDPRNAEELPEAVPKRMTSGL